MHLLNKGRAERMIPIAATLKGVVTRPSDVNRVVITRAKKMLDCFLWLRFHSDSPWVGAVDSRWTVPIQSCGDPSAPNGAQTNTGYSLRWQAVPAGAAGAIG